MLLGLQRTLSLRLVIVLCSRMRKVLQVRRPRIGLRMRLALQVRRLKIGLRMRLVMCLRIDLWLWLRVGLWIRMELWLRMVLGPRIAPLLTLPSLSLTSVASILVGANL